MTGLRKVGFDKGSAVYNYFEHPALAVAIAVLVLVSLYMIYLPLAKKGDPNEPAPPMAIM